MKIYAIIGDSVECVEQRRHYAPPAGHIEMAGPRPSDHHIAQADGTWALPRLSHDAVWAAIKSVREAKRSGGIKVEHDGQVFWFNSDATSRMQHLGLSLEAERMAAGQPWKTLANDFVTMTPALAAALVAAGEQHDWELFTAAEAHRTAMAALADPTDYDFSGGWPQTWGEWLAMQAGASGDRAAVAGARAETGSAPSNADSVATPARAALPGSSPVSHLPGTSPGYASVTVTTGTATGHALPQAACAPGGKVQAVAATVPGIYRLLPATASASGAATSPAMQDEPVSSGRRRQRPATVQANA